MKATHKQLSGASRFARRLLGLILLTGLLLAMVAGWLWVKSLTVEVADIQPTAVGAVIDEPEFRDEAVAEEILALAEKEVGALLTKYPSSPSAWSAKARKAMSLSESAIAKEAWTKSLELDPHFTEAIYGLGLLAFGADQYEESVVFFEDVLNLDSRDPLVPIMLADSLMHAGRVKEAILRLEQHITSEPASVQAWEMLGKLHLQDRNYQRAVICLDRVLTHDPNSKDAIYALSRAHAALGDQDKAQRYNAEFRQLAQTARETNARQANAFQDRNYAVHVAAQVYVDGARIERAHGDLPAAERSMLRASALEPQNVEYMTDLQSLMLAQDKQHEVVAVTRQILLQQPDNIEQWLILGNAYSQLEQAGDAIEAFEQAIKLNPQDARCLKAQQFIRELRL